MTTGTILFGVWKDKLNHAESLKQVSLLLELLAGDGDNWPFVIGVAPNPFAHYDVSRLARGSCVEICAQNILWNRSEGSYIAELTGAMLKEAETRFAIVGHSERRLYFNESDQMILERAKGAIDLNITPIICIGETADQKLAGESRSVLKQQLSILGPLAQFVSVEQLAIAYEPVWAISTWRNAQPLPPGKIVGDIHREIRGLVGELTNSQFAESLRILYGGSVSPDNAREYLAEEGVDGALIGGASKTAESLYKTFVEGRRGFNERMVRGDRR